MNFRAFHRAIAPGFFVWVSVAACSSTTAPPKAFVSASIGPSEAFPNDCNDGSTMAILPVGSYDITEALSTTNPLRVESGTKQGGIVELSCSVTPSGSGYALQLSATIQSNVVTAGGSLVIEGTVQPNVSGSTSAGTVSASFNVAGITYGASDCTFTYTFSGAPIAPAGGPVAPGRVWGNVTCNDAATGGGQSYTCKASADVVFENCSS